MSAIHNNDFVDAQWANNNGAKPIFNRGRQMFSVPFNDIVKVEKMSDMFPSKKIKLLNAFLPSSKNTQQESSRVTLYPSREQKAAKVPLIGLTLIHILALSTIINTYNHLSDYSFDSMTIGLSLLKLIFLSSVLFIDVGFINKRAAPSSGKIERRQMVLEEVEVEALSVADLEYLGLQKKYIEQMHEVVSNYQNMLNIQVPEENAFIPKLFAFVGIDDTNSASLKPFLRLYMTRTFEAASIYQCSTIKPLSDFDPAEDGLQLANTICKNLVAINGKAQSKILANVQNELEKLVHEMWLRFVSIRSRAKEQDVTDFSLQGSYYLQEEPHGVSRKTPKEKKQKSIGGKEEQKISSVVKAQSDKRAFAPRFLSLNHRWEFIEWCLDRALWKSVSNKFQDIREGIDAKPLSGAGAGLYEIKKDKWRIYYCWFEGHFYILNWGDKKGQERHDIENAQLMKSKILCKCDQK